MCASQRPKSSRALAKVSDALAAYERTPWLRAVLQIVPVAGGPLDTLLAWRGTALARARFAALIDDINARLRSLEESANRDSLLQTEEFFEVFRATAEAVTKSASETKRERAAAFLAGTIRAGKLDDLSQQIADDLMQLRDLHLKILAGLPDVAGFGLISDFRGAPHGVSAAAYAKGLSDLARMGFIRLNTDSVGTWDSGPPAWESTEYMAIFKKAIAERTDANSAT